MALRNVQPGDLITSQDWNEIVALYKALKAQVDDLAAGGGKLPPRIIQVLPEGPRTAGDTISIYGSNFDFSQGAHQVFFGATRAVSFLPGSSDSLLIVQIPTKVDGTTEAGTALTMTVGNLNGFATWAITIKAKPEVTTGGFGFTYRGSRPATPTAGGTTLYDFDLKSFASTDLTVTITPTLTPVTPLPPGVSSFNPTVTVVDADGSVKENGQLSLAEGTTKRISVSVVIPSGTNGVRFGLTATAEAPGVTARTEPVPQQQVGLAGEQPDATVSLFEFSAIADGNASFSPGSGGLPGIDGTLSVAQNSTATIEMRADFTGIPAGTTNNYQIDARIEAPANNWTTAVNVNTPNPLPVTGPGGPQEVFVDVKAPAAATTATLRITLIRQGVTSNNRRSVAYRLQLK